MKTNHLKTIAFCSFMILGFTGLTFAQQNPNLNADIQVQIGAQLGITHDSITQLLNKLDQQNQTDDGMEHADYKVKSIQTRAKVQKALSAFEDYLRSDLFPELKSYLAEYNKIYLSHDYGDAEKSDLLKKKEVQLNALFWDASTRYSSAVYKTMAALGPDANLFFVIYLTYLKENYDSQDRYRSRQEIATQYETYEVNWFRDLILPTLLDQCYSRSCISMSASDEIILFTVSSDSFIKPIIFKTLDEKAFSLVSFQNYPNDRSYSTSDSPFISRAGDEYTALIGRQDLFPNYVHTLPFNLKESELAGAQAALNAEIAKENQQQLNDLLAFRAKAMSTLMNEIDTNYAYDQTIDEVCAIGKGTPFSCQNGLGCPTSDEYQKKLEAIKNDSELKRTSKLKLKS